jgi:hypothetical protein
MHSCPAQVEERLTPPPWAAGRRGMVTRQSERTVSVKVDIPSMGLIEPNGRQLALLRIENDARLCDVAESQRTSAHAHSRRVNVPAAPESSAERVRLKSVDL